MTCIKRELNEMSKNFCKVKFRTGQAKCTIVFQSHIVMSYQNMNENYINKYFELQVLIEHNTQ